MQLMHLWDQVAKMWRPATPEDFAGGGPGGGGLTQAEHDALLAQAAALGTTADAAPANTSATGTVPAWLRWLARGVGAPSDAAAASGTGLIGLVQALIGRLPAALGPASAAQSLSVTLSADGTFATTVGATTAAAPDDGATSGTLIGWLRAAVETLRARLPRAIVQDLTSIAGLAASTTATGGVLDLGAARITATVIVGKHGGATQADSVLIEQSDDLTTWYHVPRADGSVGNALGLSNASATNCIVIGRPSMRYVRGKISPAAGSAQPAGAALITAVHWGV